MRMLSGSQTFAEYKFRVMSVPCVFVDLHYLLFVYILWSIVPLQFVFQQNRYCILKILWSERASKSLITLPIMAPNFVAKLQIVLKFTRNWQCL